VIRLNDILDEVGKYNPSADLELVRKAYVFSAKFHQGQVRKSGEPYLVHPLEVAYILAQLKLDEASIAAGILHDVVEDTLATLDEVRGLFGNEVVEIVDGVTKLGQVGPVLSDEDKPAKPKEQREEEKQAENFRKMLVAMARDIRVILVKLADRTHNMRTLDSMKPEKQARIARETMDIYAPIANRLGISWIKLELEDLAFKYLHPEEYRQLAEEVQRTERDRERYIEETIKLLEGKLAEAGLKGQVSGRPKHLWSIWKKMKQKGVGLEGIHDIIAFRVLVPEVADCYQTLGMVHGHFKPVPGRFKDFIAIPKPNNYRSLHTTVMGPGGNRVEIQIRTEEMHHVAEEGIAAHWAYKEGKGGFSKDDAKFAWLRQLMEWQRDLKDPREFLDSVKVDLFADECFIFTPKGDVKVLPRGSTPLDFAYSVHSEVGEHCVGAKVNGRIVPLRARLKNGDIVEVLTSSNAHPTKDWLTFVRTSRAQNKIRAWIRQQERTRSLELGRDIGDREFRRYGLNFNRLVRDGKEMLGVANELGYRTVDDLVAAIGIGKVAPSQLVQRLAPDKFAEARAGDTGEEKEGGKVPGGRRLTEILRRVIPGGRSSGGVKIDGVNDVLVRFGRCCNPVPGDAIVGVVTRGRGVSVHSRNCVKWKEAEAERRIDVTWDVPSDYRRPVTLRVTSDDRAGLLARMTEIFSTNGISIIQANARALNESRAISTFEVGIKNISQLRDVMHSIEKLEGVHGVERL